MISQSWKPGTATATTTESTAIATSQIPYRSLTDREAVLLFPRASVVVSTIRRLRALRGGRIRRAMFATPEAVDVCLKATGLPPALTSTMNEMGEPGSCAVTAIRNK